ncbi:MAG: diguanylate cyclase [Sulfurimonas sp.]|nr:diguanylate cyclase [Sulfurimonas sp.]
MNHVLIIDDNVEQSRAIVKEIEKELDLKITPLNSYKETAQLLKTEERIHAAIVDPLLDDDLSAEVVDLLLEKNIPVIIYTSSDLNPDLFDEVVNKPIVDYVLKSSRNNCSIIVNLLGQVLRHEQTAILIIDDSATTRILMSLMLENLNLFILEADGVEEALKKIKEHPEIKLVLTDYNMEGQNGIDLTREIRKTRSNKEVSIIGHSSYGNAMLSADFLKNGANDFIAKPFQKEELINRVLLQLDMIDYIGIIKESSEKDFLTGIYNRKYVYEVGRKLFENAKRGNITLACAMIDIDHFKNVNDTYGHDVGDKVIIQLAQELSSGFRQSDIVGRLGGEEFCVVLSSPDVSKLENQFDKLRKKVENIVITGVHEDKTSYEFSFTISIGVTSVLCASFEEMLKFSDQKLYEAKNYGRNMVVI